MDNVIRTRKIRPSITGHYRSGANKYAHCVIELRKTDKGPELSITGKCKTEYGECGGQIADEVRSGGPAPGWDEEMLQKFCDIWDRWHLNGMRPYCEHQKALGWDRAALKEVKVYHYRLKSEILSRQNRLKHEAQRRLAAGETVQYTPEEQMIANLPYSVDSWKKLDDPNYEPAKALYPLDHGPEEIKTLGWLSQDEHPHGILGKPCPICGYKYGYSWKYEPIPDEVVCWLFSLPEED